VRRLLLLGLACAAAAFAAGVGSGGRAARVEESPTPPRPRIEMRSPDVAPAAPSRNVFEYGDPAPPTASAPVLPLPVGPRPEATPPSPVRLVGLVALGGGRTAALSIEGTVVLLAPGQSALGYTLLSLDADSGARIRAPDGVETVLAIDPRASATPF
jgi:hypothetical protein